MGINIFDLQPTTVSKDLSGKSFLIYGARKSGKTTNAVKFPKPILLAFEKGYGMLSGIYAQPINTWKEALEVKKQLLGDVKSVDAGDKKETSFKTVVVDTCDLAYDMCEKYIVDKEGVEYLDESQNMRAYRALSREYDKFFQEIVKAGYTLVCISHATTKQVKEKGEKYDKTIPTLPDRGFLVVSRLVDVTAYAYFNTDEEGNVTPTLRLRGDKYLEAGSRNKYMCDEIPFTYEALRDEMARSMEELEKNGATVVEKKDNLFADQTEKVNFKEVMNKVKKIALKLRELDRLDEYDKIVAEYLGKNRRVMDCTEDQADQVSLILEDLEALLKDEGIEI